MFCLAAGHTILTIFKNWAEDKRTVYFHRDGYNMFTFLLFGVLYPTLGKYDASACFSAGYQFFNNRYLNHLQVSIKHLFRMYLI